MTRRSIFLFLFGLSSSVSATTKQDFHTWSLLCGDGGNCSLSQVVAKDREATKILLGANVNYSLSKAFPVLILRLPPNVHQNGGVGIKIDQNKAIQVPLSQCTKVACQSVIKIDDVLLSELQAGEKAVIAYAINGTKQMTLPLSLKGFSEGFSALQAHNAGG